MYKNAIFLMANTAVGSGTGFFFWMVVAMFHTPCEAGSATAIILVMRFIGTLSRSGCRLVRFLPAAGENTRATKPPLR
ncbi:MAG: hypothetical protein ACE5QW_09660 [Thermoplasmata archaeon]